MEYFLASNLALGLVLIGTVATLAWRWRRALADLTRATQRTWRAVAWLAFGATGALVLWGTLADSWRKLLAEALDFREQFASQRAVPQPVPHDIRLVTLLLLALSLLAVACLFARHVGGYLLQIALLISGGVAFVPLYLVRQRLDTGLAGIGDLPPLFSLAMVATLIYLAVDYAANISLLLTTYLGLLGLTALPVTIVLDLSRQREPPASTEATAFYATLGGQATTNRAPTIKHGEHPPR